MFAGGALGFREQKSMLNRDCRVNSGSSAHRDEGVGELFIRSRAA